MRINVFHHCEHCRHGEHDDRKLDLILELLTILGGQVTALSDAVDALQTRITEDVNHLLDLIQQGLAREAQLQADLATARADDEADDAAVAAAQAAAADAQAAREAVEADAQATVDRLGTIDPVADFPGVVEPPAEEPPA